MKIRALTAVAVLTTFAFSTGTTSAASTAGGMELEFAGDTAAYAAGQVSVPVECIGEATGFCSGTLTLSWHGKKSVSTYSVQGGGRETVIVPLPVQQHGQRTKVAALATTAQRLGPEITRKAVLHLG